MSAFQDFFDTVKPHLNAIALAATWAGICVAWFRRRSRWKLKAFPTQVNFSLNYLVGDALAMRTLLETSAQSIWLNEFGVGMVFAAARRAPLEQPFLVLPNAIDQAFVNRAALNVLSERFAETYLAAALGLPVRTSSFLFGVTCEKYPEIRTQKIRVLVIEQRTLEDLFGEKRLADKLVVTNPIYQQRLRTLRMFHELAEKDKTTPQPLLGQIELGVPLPSTDPFATLPHGSPHGIGTSASHPC